MGRALWFLRVTGEPCYEHVAREVASESWHIQDREGNGISRDSIRRLLDRARKDYDWFRFLWHRWARARPFDDLPTPRPRQQLAGRLDLTMGQVQALYVYDSTGSMEAAGLVLGIKKAALSRKLRRYRERMIRAEAPNRRRGRRRQSDTFEPHGRDAAGSGVRQGARSDSEKRRFGDPKETGVQVPLYGPGHDGTSGTARIGAGRREITFSALLDQAVKDDAEKGRARSKKSTDIFYSLLGSELRHSPPEIE
jgi:hypothetical protein